MPHILFVRSHVILKTLVRCLILLGIFTTWNFIPSSRTSFAFIYFIDLKCCSVQLGYVFFFCFVCFLVNLIYLSIFLLYLTSSINFIFASCIDVSRTLILFIYLFECLFQFFASSFVFFCFYFVSLFFVVKKCVLNRFLIASVSARIHNILEICIHNKCTHNTLPFEFEKHNNNKSKKNHKNRWLDSANQQTQRTQTKQNIKTKLT